MPARHYNPESRAWRGRSYKNGRQVRDLRDAHLEDRGAEPEEAPAAPPVEKTFVVIVVVSGKEYSRIFCENAATAVEDYSAMQRSWEYDDRLDYIEIRDADGKLFRPTADNSGICGPRYLLPLTAVSK